MPPKALARPGAKPMLAIKEGLADHIGRQSRHATLLKGTPVEFIFMLFGGVIGSAIGALIGGLLLCVALAWAAKSTSTYGRAFVTVFTASILTFAIGLFSNMLLEMIGVSIAIFAGVQLVMALSSFFVQSAVIADRHELAYGRACLVSLAMIGLYILIGLVLFLGIMAIAAATGSFTFTPAY